MPTAFPSVSSGSQTLPLIPPTSSPASQSQAGSAQDAPFRLPVDASGNSMEASPPRAYHRTAEVRQQQGFSLRTISRRTGLDVKELRRQENPSTNLTLAQLLIWQRALEVPLVDLLVDGNEVLSRPVKERAQMVRIMKTIVSLGEAAQCNVRLGRLTSMLREQVLQLMPELAEVGGWPQCGSRRGPDVFGRIVHEPIAIDMEE